jgi:hypothetical protein
MIRNFGTIVEKDLVEVIELENGEVYEISGGVVRNFRKLNRKFFERALITHEYTTD